MKNETSTRGYTRHRFPPGVIGHAVWLHFHFALSYRAAHRAILPSVAHRRHEGWNNRAEHSHRPTRERERRMRRFKSPGHAQRCRAATA